MGDYGSFSGNPKTEWLVDEGPDRRMALLEDFWYIDPAGRTWPAPKGTVIDGASIPQVLWSTVGSPYTGDYRRASIVHDAAYGDPKVDKREADVMFYYACLEGGCSELEARYLYTGIRIWMEAGADQKTEALRNVLEGLKKLKDEASIADLDAFIAKHL